MEGASFWIAALAVALAACAQGMTGFGFSVVCVPVLLAVLSPSTVVVVALLLSLGLTLSLLPGAPSKVRLNRTWPLFAFSLLGAALGGWLLPRVGEAAWLKPAMGAAAFLGGLGVLVSAKRAAFRRERTALAVTGVVSGLMNSLASLSGPPAAIIAVRQRWEAADARKTLLAYSLFVNAAALLALAPSGLLDGPRLRLALLLVPAVAMGRMLGNAGRRRLPAHRFRYAALGLVLFCGVASAAEALAAAAK